MLRVSPVLLPPTLLLRVTHCLLPPQVSLADEGMVKRVRGIAYSMRVRSGMQQMFACGRTRMLLVRRCQLPR